MINYSNLLNREEININNIDKLNYINDKVILITGGVGSIGSEILRQLVKFNCKIIVYDNNECSYFYIKNELKSFDNITYILGDIMEYEKLENVFKTYNIDIVYHAAAYKHVPIMEDNEYESVRVNVIGTKNISDLSLKYKVKKFIYVSTDKAVNPTNVMGCCKRVSETYIKYLYHQSKTTEFITTRFGNVLGSSGSVIPAFIEAINQNKNLEITHKDITRYFMTIPEAAKLVLLSSCICNGDQTVLFDMGDPVKIYDLGKNILKHLNREDLSLVIVGLRPGEKMYEELSYTHETAQKVKYDKIIILQSDEVNYDTFINNYNKLISIKSNIDKKDIRVLLKTIVPEYNY